MVSVAPLIAVAPDGGDVLRRRRVVLNLDAQAADVHVDDLDLAAVIRAPDGVENVLARERTAGIFHEQLHDRKLRLRQADVLAVFVERARAQVQHERAAREHVLGALAAADAAVERVHAREQLGGGEGLRNIVVGAGHEAGNLVHLLALGAEHEDAHLGAGRADAAADLKAVNVRQHHVEQGDERVRILLELFERLFARSRLNGFVTGAAQVDDDEAADAGFILKYENFLHVICIPFQRRCVDAFVVCGVCFPGKQKKCRNIHFSISHNLQ